MKVELIKTPERGDDYNYSIEDIKQYIADCSSVVRNKQPKDNDRLFDRLLKESYGDRPSRVLEYIPVLLNGQAVIEMVGTDNIQLFGFFKFGNYYTNFREVGNWGWKLEETLSYIDFTHYKAVRVTAPYFVYSQISTHCEITSVSHSNRYTASGMGYWHPEEFTVYKRKQDCKITDEQLGELWGTRVENTSPVNLEAFMKDTLKIKRREIFARGRDMLQYRSSTLGGYTNNPNAWPHFLHQRGDDLHTQMETRRIAMMIREAIQER